MFRFQRYILLQALWPVLNVLIGLTLVALLSQTLSNLDLIVDKRQSALALLWVTMLALPQVLSLILPLALFFAVVYALNRMLLESELVVVYATGLSPWQAAAPILRLAVVATAAHLAVTTLLQPLAYREMRETLREISSDIASAALRPGAFLSPIEGLTLYVREEREGFLYDVLIQDTREAGVRKTYSAERAEVAIVSEEPVIVLHDGEFQTRRSDGQVDFGAFGRNVVQMDGLFDKTFANLLKPSDRFLGELFYPDKTYFYDQRNIDRFLAEGHFRLSSPLYSLALTAIALAALLGGEYSRHGFRNRILVASLIALLVRLGALGVQSAASDAPALNGLQYALPLLVCLVCAIMVSRSGRRPRGRPASAQLDPSDGLVIT